MQQQQQQYARVRASHNGRLEHNGSGIEHDGISGNGLSTMNGTSGNHSMKGDGSGLGHGNSSLGVSNAALGNAQMGFGRDQGLLISPRGRHPSNAVRQPPRQSKRMQEEEGKWERDERITRREIAKSADIAPPQFVRPETIRSADAVNNSYIAQKLQDYGEQAPNRSASAKVRDTTTLTRILGKLDALITRVDGWMESQAITFGGVESTPADKLDGHTELVAALNQRLRELDSKMLRILAVQGSEKQQELVAAQQRQIRSQLKLVVKDTGAILPPSPPNELATDGDRGTRDRESRPRNAAPRPVAHLDAACHSLQQMQEQTQGSSLQETPEKPEEPLERVPREPLERVDSSALPRTSTHEKTHENQQPIPRTTVIPKVQSSARAGVPNTSPQVQPHSEQSRKDRQDMQGMNTGMSTADNSNPGPGGQAANHVQGVKVASAMLAGNVITAGNAMPSGKGMPLSSGYGGAGGYETNNGMNRLNGTPERNPSNSKDRAGSRDPTNNGFFQPIDFSAKRSLSHGPMGAIKLQPSSINGGFNVSTGFSGNLFRPSPRGSLPTGAVSQMAQQQQQRQMSQLMQQRRMYNQTPPRQQQPGLASATNVPSNAHKSLQGNSSAASRPSVPGGGLPTGQKKPPLPHPHSARPPVSLGGTTTRQNQPREEAGKASDGGSQHSAKSKNSIKSQQSPQSQDSAQRAATVQQTTAANLQQNVQVPYSATTVPQNPTNVIPQNPNSTPRDTGLPPNTTYSTPQNNNNNFRSPMQNRGNYGNSSYVPSSVNRMQSNPATSRMSVPITVNATIGAMSGFGMPQSSRNSLNQGANGGSIVQGGSNVPQGMSHTMHSGFNQGPLGFGQTSANKRSFSATPRLGLSGWLPNQWMQSPTSESISTAVSVSVAPARAAAATSASSASGGDPGDDFPSRLRSWLDSAKDEGAGRKWNDKQFTDILKSAERHGLKDPQEAYKQYVEDKVNNAVASEGKGLFGGFF